MLDIFHVYSNCTVAKDSVSKHEHVSIRHTLLGDNFSNDS